MFELLQIQNFQAHDKLRIEFDKAITCIVGPSDVGKSAIIRALRWICINNPGGDAFVRHGTKGSTVKLVVDGHTITRRRSPGGVINTYHLDDAEYKAFGRGVPEPIEHLLNLGPVCWQGQHDAPYWFSDSAGEVSRQLNAIVDLGIIDETLSNVVRTLHRGRTKLEMAEEELTEANKQHNSLAWVPGFSDAVAGLEAKETEYTEAARAATVSASLLKATQAHQATHERVAGAALAGLNLVKCGEEAIEAQNRADMLHKLVSAAKEHAVLGAVSVPDIAPMEEAMFCFKKIVIQSNTINMLIRDTRTKETKLCRLEKELEAAEKAIPDQCPVCGQSV